MTALANTLVRFPAAILRSHEEFRQWSRENRDLLDERYRREQELGTSEASLVLNGTCGVCMNTVSFRSVTVGGETTLDGRLVPNWRENQICSCDYRLSARQRALLHCLLFGVTAPHWCESAAIGPPDALTEALVGIVKNLRIWPSFQVKRGRMRLPGHAASIQLVASSDYLDMAGPLERAFGEVSRVLVPGGSFVFSAPFHFDHVTTTPGAGLRHQLGWDILSMALQAGFVDAAAYCYWSEELGYLGPFNMIFKAVR